MKILNSAASEIFSSKIPTFSTLKVILPMLTEKQATTYENVR